MREQHRDKSLQIKINWLCAIVFAIFCFSFVGVFQAPLLEAFYDLVATGKLQYNEYVVAGAVTTVFVIFALWLNRFAKFTYEWTAFSYFPSSLLLAFITDIDESIYTGDSSFVSWVWILVGGFFFYAVMALLMRSMLLANIRNACSGTELIIWRNFLLFALLFSLTGILSDSDESFKNEAKAYSLFKRGKTDEALGVAIKSLNASHGLTAARAFYLADRNMLADRLFEYPQYYAAEGLLPSVTQKTALPPDTVYAMLGAERKAGETATDYLRRIVRTDSMPSPIATDYYLCALLLDKKITEFITELSSFYNIEDNESLPKHYKEALIYYNSTIHSFDNIIVRPASEADVEPDSLTAKLQRMFELEKQYSELHIRSNYIRKHFGNTYWWYFAYSE